MLSLCGPQERVQRRTVQQIVDPVPLIPTLDDAAPQMVEQLPDILHFLRALSLDLEQAIEVPKILPVDVPMRTAVRDTQLAEQLVEVPTIVSLSSLQRIAEQNVDIPIVVGSGTGEQIDDNPVPRRSFSGDLQGVFPQDRDRRSGLRTRSLTFQFQVEVLKIFLKLLHRSGVSSDLPDGANQGFF